MVSRRDLGHGGRVLRSVRIIFSLRRGGDCFRLRDRAYQIESDGRGTFEQEGLSRLLEEDRAACGAVVRDLPRHYGVAAFRSRGDTDRDKHAVCADNLLLYRAE